MRPLALLTLLLAPALAEAQANEGPFQRIAVIRLREETGEQIDPSVRQSVLRRIEQIRKWGADCVILDIESYGGRVDSSIETGDEIYALGRDVHTVAYVGRKAISGAALLSLACREIVMSEVAKIGDCQAVFMTPEGIQQAPEKIQSSVASAFRTYAEGNGYPIPVVEAMVRQEMEVVRYRRRAPHEGQREWAYFRSDTPDGLPARSRIEEEFEEPPEVVVRAGELAVFTARQALDYDVCSRLEPTLESLIASLGTEETRVLTYEWNWSERVSRLLLQWQWLLFLLGAGSVYFALKTPGTGIPEALAVICFGLFFGASAVADFAGTIEVVLFFIGVALLVVEIFLLPGFGVPGILGLVCILTSIGLASIPEGAGVPAPSSEYLLPVARDFLAGTFGAIVAVILVARYLPTIPFFRSLRLQPAVSQTGSAVGTAEPRPDHALVGARGVAETQLRPAGRAVVDGRRLDVVTEGRFVQPGTPVRVIAVRGNVITVRPEA